MCFHGAGGTGPDGKPVSTVRGGGPLAQQPIRAVADTRTRRREDTTRSALALNRPPGQRNRQSLAARLGASLLRFDQDRPL